MRDRLIKVLDASFAEQYDKRMLMTAPHTADALLAAGATIREKSEWKEVRIIRYNGSKPYTKIAHECGRCKYLNKKGKGWNTNFCPNCGAEMKGDRNER